EAWNKRIGLNRINPLSCEILDRHPAVPFIHGSEQIGGRACVPGVRLKSIGSKALHPGLRDVLDHNIALIDVNDAGLRKCGFKQLRRAERLSEAPTGMGP